MNKNTILALVIGLVIGVGGTLGVSAVTDSDNSPTTNTTQQQTAATDHSTMSMADMNKELEKLSGDDFDKAFLEMMVSHHEGAINMASLVPERAKHDEIKKLGEAIISAQTKEISDMKQWQKDWGYSSDEMMRMMH